MYYLQSRYYDPAIGRFINADTFATTDADGFLSCNMFAYCENNPVNRSDETGDISHIIIGIGVGALVGVLGQVASDVVTSVLTGRLTISSLNTYVGSIVGGAASGGVLAATGNVQFANAVSGAVTTGTNLILDKAFKKSNDTWTDIGTKTIFDGLVSFGLGELPGIKGITKGRNSFSAVYRSGLTKLRNGTALKMSARVAKKGFASNFVGGLAMDFYYGIKQKVSNFLNQTR